MMIKCLTLSVPILHAQTKVSKKLISTDDKSNISNFKFTNYVEICPLCKDDLLYLPAKTARNLGNISRLVLVKNISNLIHLIDPLTGQTASMTSDAYWRDPIRPIITASRARLSRFVVLGKEPVVLRQNVSKRATSKKQKSKLADLTLAKAEDLGINDVQYEERSHIGYLMKAGDVCAGYDLKKTQFMDDEAEELREAGKVPDIVILRKLYGGVASNDSNAAKMRMWRLKRLDVDVADAPQRGRGARKQEDDDDMDEEDFMQEVEADREMRQNMNLYKSDVAVKKIPDGSMDTDNNDNGDGEEDEDDQQVRLDELLDNLALDAGPDGMDEFAGNEEGEGGHPAYPEGEKAAKDGIGYVSREEARNIKTRDAAVPVAGGQFGKEYSLDEIDPDL